MVEINYRYTVFINLLFELANFVLNKISIDFEFESFYLKYFLILIKFDISVYASLSFANTLMY